MFLKLFFEKAKYLNWKNILAATDSLIDLSFKNNSSFAFVKKMQCKDQGICKYEKFALLFKWPSKTRCCCWILSFLLLHIRRKKNHFPWSTFIQFKEWQTGLPLPYYWNYFLDFLINDINILNSIFLGPMFKLPVISLILSEPFLLPFSWTINQNVIGLLSPVFSYLKIKCLVEGDKFLVVSEREE